MFLFFLFLKKYMTCLMNITSNQHCFSDIYTIDLFQASLHSRIWHKGLMLHSLCNIACSIEMSILENEYCFYNSALK